MNHIMAVYDEEEYYAVRLVDYLNLKEKFPFEVICFKDIEKIKEFCRCQKLDILLVSEQLKEDVKELVLPEQCILLSRQKEYSDDGYKRIFKYQSCENIIREVMTLMADKSVESKRITRTSHFCVTGFYSPVKRVYQTAASLKMSELLSKKGKTLYISLEGYSALEVLIGQTFHKNMSDFMYRIQSGKTDIQCLLGSMTVDFNKVTILPPMVCQTDLISVSGQDWIQLLKELERYTDYQYLVLDLSDSVQGLSEILRQCDRVLTLTGSDEGATTKLKQYEKMLQNSQYYDVWEKTRQHEIQIKDKIPDYKDIILSRELTESIRKVVQEDSGVYG